ncbi:hypothetical protein AAE478_001689 [Parahypoxylon ruwenzoriense]
MLFRAISSLALMALAGQAIAEPLRQPYKLELARMSTRNLFGLQPRQDEGYAPEQQFCGAGDTCAEACGKGFERCASNDGIVHCFNTSAKQSCCPGLTGDSCDEGYFCSADDKGATWCCPDSMTLKECAAAYNLPGSLVSETAPATSTTESPTSTRAPATTTSSSVSTAKTTTTQKAAPETTSSVSVSASISVSKSNVSYTSDFVQTIAPTSLSATTNASTTTSAGATPTPPVNGIVTAGGDRIHASIGGIALLAAAAVAALL